MTKSNMYEFIGKTINPLSGECKHSCKYCYVETLKSRFKVIKDKYSGDIRLDEKVLKTKLKKDVLYFICSCNDLFAENVPDEMIIRILNWIGDTKVLLQTKNVDRMFKYVNEIKNNPNATVCITVETCKNDLIIKYSKAPVADRMFNIYRIAKILPTQITIEPIMNLGNITNIGNFADELIRMNLQQINIGANSNKNINLPEPSQEELEYFIKQLKSNNINVHLKENLKRLL